QPIADVDRRVRVRHADVHVQRRGRRALQQPAHGLADGLVARRGDVLDLPERRGGMQARADRRAAGRVQLVAQGGERVPDLRRHALVLGEVTLTSGRTARYYVDAKRAILRPAGFAALAELVAQAARDAGATAVGGLTLGADAPACAALAGGADVKAFFVRK